ncbi:hypothetical protein PPACK8108_LOCUS4995 [Phakopsora pachyrhizi]|uniref:Uncharacterized protein n=1 Tax=Phakopsora pachyrhizi TaxID=170000 RepID=A0AAV0APH2_PHAPC|nr:hypothetical protein PPACK8108_LOCUS4995 [Phakopsora pachyrhizi]
MSNFNNEFRPFNYGNAQFSIERDNQELDQIVEVIQTSCFISEVNTSNRVLGCTVERPTAAVCPLEFPSEFPRLTPSPIFNDNSISVPASGKFQFLLRLRKRSWMRKLGQRLIRRYHEALGIKTKKLSPIIEESAEEAASFGNTPQVHCCIKTENKFSSFYYQSTLGTEATPVASTSKSINKQKAPTSCKNEERPTSSSRKRFRGPVQENINHQSSICNSEHVRRSPISTGPRTSLELNADMLGVDPSFISQYAESQTSLGFGSPNFYDSLMATTWGFTPLQLVSNPTNPGSNVEQTRVSSQTFETSVLMSLGLQLSFHALRIFMRREFDLKFDCDFSLLSRSCSI